jgi:hypothetical protein
MTGDQVISGTGLYAECPKLYSQHKASCLPYNDYASAVGGEADGPMHAMVSHLSAALGSSFPVVYAARDEDYGS